MPSNYPPVVFKPRLREILESRQLHPQEWLIKRLKISNVTAKRILSGCDVRLNMAIKICRLLDLELHHVWPEAGR